MTSVFPERAYLRLGQIIQPLGPLPISRSAWWSGVASGAYPAPVKLGPRTTAWRTADLNALVARLDREAGR
jgi:prophage regulatory protein